MLEIAKIDKEMLLFDPFQTATMRVRALLIGDWKEPQDDRGN
jgi:hypothetical protein